MIWIRIYHIFYMNCVCGKLENFQKMTSAWKSHAVYGTSTSSTHAMDDFLCGRCTSETADSKDQASNFWTLSPLSYVHSTSTSCGFNSGLQGPTSLRTELSKGSFVS